MESGHGSRKGGNLRTHPDTSTHGEGNLSTHHKKLRNSSSESSLTSGSSSGDPFQLDENEIRMSNTETIAPTEVHNNARLASARSDGDIPVSSMPVQERSSYGSEGPSPPPEIPGHSHGFSSTDGSATQYPPMQVMDRAGDSTSSSYRIPSAVFSRTKSTTPMEWSVASNESLFSIHMGNMSFTRDQLLLGKSGELGVPGELSMSSPFIDISSNQPPICKKSANMDERAGASEAAIETMREVIRENAQECSKEKLPSPEPPSHSGSLSRRSDVSGASIKSFAFPILTANGGKSGSLKPRSPNPLSKAQSPELPSPKAQSPTKTEAPNLETPKSQMTPKAASKPAQNRWFSCFSCCPFCI